MTVSNKPPIAEYEGNGSQTVFAWDWDMIADSTINVILDDQQTTDFSVQANTVVLNTPPADGVPITIYRRTKIWQPENYRAFGRFNSEKTELSVDRAILIAQEINGTAIDSEPPNGIVGGADIYYSPSEGAVTVISERGSDAVIPLWAGDDAIPPEPGPADPSIIWAGTDIVGGQFSLPGNSSGISAQIRFRMDYTGSQAEAFYNSFNDFVNVGWVNVDPADGDYWMRVTETSELPNSKYTINDGDNTRNSGEAFPIKGSTVNPVFGPYVSVNTFGDSAPIVRTGTFVIEICKDLNGLPDEGWASRNVMLEAIFNVDNQQLDVLMTEDNDPLVTEDDDELII